jgi:hypothetical protein
MALDPTKSGSNSIVAPKRRPRGSASSILTGGRGPFGGTKEIVPALHLKNAGDAGGSSAGGGFGKRPPHQWMMNLEARR